MLHGRHDRKIEGGGETNHRADPMRLPPIQQNNSKNLPRVAPANAGTARVLTQSSAATLSKNE
jgi:hypothetical protein